MLNQKITILYARASSRTQKDDLERQVRVLEEWVKQNNVEKYEVITDIGSGLNEDRKGFKKILKLASINIYLKYTKMWGFPHSCELELDEGELWVGVTLNGWRPMTWAPMKRCPEVHETKGRFKQHQPT